MRGAQLSTIAEMVSAGLGVSMVPAMMTKTDDSDSRVSRPFSGEQPMREICLAWSLLRYRTQAARAMEQTIRQRLP
jgi:DNA-binding transcriptional LysR family regulator